jgi:hypothetical protein
MDVGQQSPKAYENVNPQFVWELERAHTKTVAKQATGTEPVKVERPTPTLQ